MTYAQPLLQVRDLRVDVGGRHVLKHRLVWVVLAGSSVGLLASTLGRLYASTFWALHDTRTPLRFAVLRVSLSAALGASLAFGAPRLLGLDARLGLAGLTLGSGLAGWLEMLLLRRALNARVGKTGLPASFSLRVWGAALCAAAARSGRSRASTNSEPRSMMTARASVAWLA